MQLNYILNPFPFFYFEHLSCHAFSELNSVAQAGLELVLLHDPLEHCYDSAAPPELFLVSLTVKSLHDLSIIKYLLQMTIYVCDVHSCAGVCTHVSYSLHKF